MEKVKTWCVDAKKDLFVAAFVFLTGLGGFGLGRLSVLWPAKDPVVLIDGPAGNQNPNTAGITPAASTADSAISQGQYVASRSGSYYYLPSCPGAKRIKDANKVWLRNRQEAEGRGLKPAANCPGL